MSKQNFYLIFIILILFTVGCSSHPPVLPQIPVKGETNTGFSFSAENLIPVIWWRHGLNKYTDIGLKIGIPWSGTGIDINRVLKKRDRRWEVLNLAYSVSPNSSFRLVLGPRGGAGGAGGAHQGAVTLGRRDDATDA